MAAHIRAHAIAGVLARHLAIGIDEIARPVLFRGHIGVPRRHAVGTIGQRAARMRAVRAVKGCHLGMAACRARNFHTGQAGNAPVARVGHDPPVAIRVSAHAHDRDTMRVKFFQHMIGRSRPGMIGRAPGADLATLRHGVMQKARLDIFMVHHQKAVGGTALPRAIAFNGEEVHAVMMHAGLMGLILAGIVRCERRKITADRIAPAIDDPRLITVRHDDSVGRGYRHGVEPQRRTGRCVLRLGPACAGRHRPGHKPADRQAQPAAQEAAPVKARLDHIGKRPVARIVGFRLEIGIESCGEIGHQRLRGDSSWRGYGPSSAM